MAGLPDYLMMGFGVAAVYIGVKYGPQIITNLKQNQDQSGSKTQQPSDTSTSTTSSPTTDATDADNTYNPTSEGPSPDTSTTTTAIPTTITSPAQTPPSGQPKHRPTNRPQPHPVARHRQIPRHGGGGVSIHPNVHCICMPDKTLGGPGCNAIGRDCSLAPKAEQKAYLGYFDYYSVPVTGPQWRKSIPSYKMVASQGTMTGTGTGRVRRAVAAGNHNFMPGGFVLSEASVRRGVNNVYSAGT